MLLYSPLIFQLYTHLIDVVDTSFLELAYSKLTFSKI